jgi:hypothetical protein
MAIKSATREPTHNMRMFEPFGDIADDLISSIFSFLTAEELTKASYMSRRMLPLAKLNELWMPLCVSNWKDHHHGEDWIGTVESFLCEGSSSIQQCDEQRPKTSPTFWHAQFLKKKNTSYIRHVFVMGGLRPLIGTSFPLHFFEPRYCWLASILMEEPEQKRYLCVSPRNPIIDGIGLICKVTSLHILPDGRANIMLLPLTYCRFLTSWRLEVPLHPNYPKLFCGKVKEISMKSASILAKNSGSDLFINNSYSHRDIAILVALLAALLMFALGR